jgi:cupin superfamily acireductone dioxygenase involved in methionine salvage
MIIMKNKFDEKIVKLKNELMDEIARFFVDGQFVFDSKNKDEESNEESKEKDLGICIPFVSYAYGYGYKKDVQVKVMQGNSSCIRIFSTEEKGEPAVLVFDKGEYDDIRNASRDFAFLHQIYNAMVNV